MKEFEQVLEECLRDLERGASNLDECLARHPQYEQQLMPILLTNAYLERTREARPSAAFKARVRAKLTREMQAHPRPKPRFHFLPFMQLAVSFAIILLALATAGTAYAQGALPGNLFYGWKLASENVWRAMSPDPVKTDLTISERRVGELIAVADDPARRSQAQESYLEVVARLRSEIDAENEARILSRLDAQKQQLDQSGISVPQPDQNQVPGVGLPTLTPTNTMTPETPTPTQEIPQASPTDLLPLLPTQTPNSPPILPPGLNTNVPSLPPILPPIIPPGLTTIVPPRPVPRIGTATLPALIP